MKATNQGFVDLHTPAGFFLVGTAFLALTVIIILGAIYGRKLAEREREQRRLLKEQLEHDQAHPDRS